MITERDEEFMKYWERSRDSLATTTSKIMRGLPMALMFGLPILLLVAVVYFFFPDWYTRISGALANSVGIIVVAVMIAVIFYAYVRMHFKWEMDEQYYRELEFKIKNKKEEQ